MAAYLAAAAANNTARNTTLHYMAGAPCYRRDYLKMTGLKKHLSSGLHKVCIFQWPVMTVSNS